jgi:hypothetical protein
MNVCVCVYVCVCVCVYVCVRIVYVRMYYVYILCVHTKWVGERRWGSGGGEGERVAEG